MADKLKLLDLLNKEWLSNSFPSQWRHSLIVPIKKLGKSGRSPEDFRPISLTSCGSKILETMINRRLINYFNEHNLPDPQQHAFRPGQGNGTYFGTLGQNLDDAMKDKMHVELATLDISKACNLAWMPEVI